MTTRTLVVRTMREVLDERRLPRARDADPDQVDARGRARLPRAEPADRRLVVRAAAEPAAVQAALHDGRLRALLPDRSLLPRRGSARRPPARVHAARPRDELRRRGRRDRGHGGGDGRGLRGDGLRRARPGRGRRCVTTRPSGASASTGPTRASASRSTTSPSSCAASEFKVFEGVLAGGGVVRAINAGAREMSRSELDGLNEVVQIYGAKAVAPIYAGDGGWAGNLAKFFTAEQIAAVNAELGASDGDLLLFVADKREVAAASLGGLRLELGRRFGLIPEGRHDVLWIVDFPMFERDEEAGRWTALHHPFTAPKGDLARSGRAALARLRPRPRRRRDRRRLDPHPHPRGPERRLRAHRARTRTRRASASASCSTRCATARRRTAASRWASTGSSRSPAASTRSAT